MSVHNSELILATYMRLTLMIYSVSELLRNLSFDSVKTHQGDHYLSFAQRALCQGNSSTVASHDNFEELS